MGVVFNLGFLLVSIYISIYYFHEFYYFKNLDNISIIENNSDYVVNFNINNKACDNNTNKEIYLLKSKYFESIDLYGSRTDISLPASNMVTKNSSDNDRLSIVKYLEIYRSIRVDFNKIQNELINHNLDLANKIYKLEKGFDYTSNIINEIIDSYINDFSC